MRSLRLYVLASFRDAKWMNALICGLVPWRQRADFKELLARVDELEPAYITAYSYTATPEAKLAARQKILTALEALAGTPPMCRYVRRNLAQARQDLVVLSTPAASPRHESPSTKRSRRRQQLVQECPPMQSCADLAESQTAAGDLFASAGKLADAGKTWGKRSTRWKRATSHTR